LRSFTGRQGEAVFLVLAVLRLYSADVALQRVLSLKARLMKFLLAIVTVISIISLHPALRAG
jgi:hypothetical protein